MHVVYIHTQIYINTCNEKIHIPLLHFWWAKSFCNSPKCMHLKYAYCHGGYLRQWQVTTFACTENAAWRGIAGLWGHWSGRDRPPFLFDLGPRCEPTEVFPQLFGGGAPFAEGFKSPKVVLWQDFSWWHTVWHTSHCLGQHVAAADKSSEMVLNCSSQEDRNKGSERALGCLLIGNRFLGNLMLPIPLPTCSLTQSNATPWTPSLQTCGNELVLWPPTLLARFLPCWWWFCYFFF